MGTMRDNVSLLFERVGLNPGALQLLYFSAENKKISSRACQFWFNGERTPKSNILGVAHYLDKMMDSYASQILKDSKKENLWVISYSNDDELWANNSSMFGLSNSVHRALINRMVILGRCVNVTVHTIPSKVDDKSEDDHYPDDIDWNDIVNVWIDTKQLLTSLMEKI